MELEAWRLAKSGQIDSSQLYAVLSKLSEKVIFSQSIHSK